MFIFICLSLMVALLSWIVFDAGRFDSRYSGNLTPIAIGQSRYGGELEGGLWFAIPNTEIVPDEAVGDFVNASFFWSSSEATLIGRGRTPNEALRDMVKRNGPTVIRIDLTQ